jgi:hypothetical protein
LLAVAAALLALAPTAHADVTIGSDLATEPNQPLAFDSLGSTAAPLGATVPFSGVITRWRVRVGATSTPVRLRILRPSLGVEVGRSDLEPAPPVGSPRVVHQT